MRPALPGRQTQEHTELLSADPSLGHRLPSDQQVRCPHQKSSFVGTLCRDQGRYADAEAL
jgi:hypothetical protein